MCDLCGSTHPSTSVVLRHNIGMLVARQIHSTDGRLCADCLRKAFTKHQLTNLFLGWWGTVSFFATFYYLIANTFTFFGARRELARIALPAFTEPR